MLIPLVEYAAKHGLQPCAIRRRCRRGTIASAVKVGRDWWIDQDEPLIDYRCYPYCIDRRYGSPPDRKTAETITRLTFKYARP